MNHTLGLGAENTNPDHEAFSLEKQCISLFKKMSKQPGASGLVLAT